MDQAGGCEFYLGTHMPAWLRRTSVRLFVSRRRLARYKGFLPMAEGPWSCDSGGFSELAMFGEFKTSAEQYADEVLRYAEEIGQMEWAAPQDWMCEPFMLERTGKTIREHQALTVESYLRLRELAPTVPWIPVLQGWTIGDYVQHAETWESAGVNLADCSTVGVGSICRRQSTRQAEEIVRAMSAAGFSLHLFGFKIEGLRRVSRYAKSADSMAWSAAGRHIYPCPKGNKTCSNCFHWAMKWRQEVLTACAQPNQEVFNFQPQGECYA